MGQLPLLRCHECGALTFDGASYGGLATLFINFSKYLCRQNTIGETAPLQPANFDAQPKKSGLASIATTYNFLSINPLTLLFGENLHKKSLKELDSASTHGGRSYLLNKDLSPSLSNDGKRQQHTRPPDPLRPRIEYELSDLPHKPQSTSMLPSHPTHKPPTPKLRVFNSSGPCAKSKLNQHTSRQMRKPVSQSPSIIQSSSTPSPKSSKKRRPRRNRNFSRRNTWELHYHYLTQRLPTHTIPDRNDPHLHSLWLESSNNHPYTRDRRCRRLQNLRLAFISEQRVRLSREKHVRKVLWARERLRRRRLYQFAYLKFKRERINVLSEAGKLNRAYQAGWSPFREWKAWRRIRLFLRQKEGMKFWRRRDKRRLVLDKIQQEAERNVF